MIDIVIVNWNAGDLLRNCIQSIIECRNIEIVQTIFIVDNHSRDESLSFINPHEKIEIIENPGNYGFARACNQAFEKCSSKYVLLLNPDTILYPETLEKCESFMNDNLDIDILGCQLLDEKENISLSCARFPTPLRYFYDATGLSKLSPHIFTPAILMSDWDHKSDRIVDQVMGAFMFMRRNVFDKIGYFDERFFVYLEELDFSKRLAEFGGKSYYNSSIKAIHFGEGTTSNVKAFRLFLNLKSRFKYSKKHFSKLGHIFLVVTTITIEPIAKSAYFLFSGRTKEIKEMIKGYKMLYSSTKK